MQYRQEKVAGILFFVAVVQFILGLTISEALYPDYRLSGNYVSDLGVGPSAIIFNLSVFLLGLLLIIGTYFMRHLSDFKMLNILLFVMAVGAMGVGVFTEDFSVAHAAASSMAFLFGGLSAMASAKIMKKPFSLVSIALGVMTIGALVLYSSGIITSGSLMGSVAYDSIFYLGLSPGGMERMVIYPALVWLAGFGAYLSTLENE
jgi:hypothetical membrane protein